jgi:CBS domain-containing protein
MAPGDACPTISGESNRIREEITMRVEDVMTRVVRTVSPDTSLREAAEILAELRISGLPVVDEGKVVGVVSEADILTKERGKAPEGGGLFRLLFEENGHARAKMLAKTAGEAMTAPAITIAPHRPVAEAAGTMIDRRVNRLPVVDDDGTLLGIVTRADLVRAFVRSDAEIAREIREDVVLHSMWIAPEQIEVKVVDGAVTLAGQLETRDDATLLPEFVKRVPGVVAVESHLTWEIDESSAREKRRSVRAY